MVVWKLAGAQFITDVTNHFTMLSNIRTLQWTKFIGLVYDASIHIYLSESHLRQGAFAARHYIILKIWYFKKGIGMSGMAGEALQ